MAISSGTRRRWAAATALRGVVMLIAGAIAVLAPAWALSVLIGAAGIIFLVDGILGVWSLTFGGAKSGNYWFDVIRNVLSIICGVIILIYWWQYPVLSTVLWAWFIAYVVAFQSIVVGVMEIVLIVREREHYARIWPVVLNGVLYVLFGIALLFAPLIGTSVMVILGGILMIFFAVGLFALAWRMYQASKGKPA